MAGGLAAEVMDLFYVTCAGPPIGTSTKTR